MPFIRMASETWEEMMEVLEPEQIPPGFPDNAPSGEFEYQAASTPFQPEDLSPVSRVVLGVLLGAGVTALVVRYDGGYDEGFAYPETMCFSEQVRPAKEVLPGLATPEVIERIRAAASEDSIWGNSTEMYARASVAEAMTYALDELGTDLASKLLGNGFGTGEYELYGAFTADLSTRTIVDDPNAVKPPEGE
jgi:hypothetical protein